MTMQARPLYVAWTLLASSVLVPPAFGQQRPWISPLGMDPPASDLSAFLSAAQPARFPGHLEVLKVSGFQATCVETRHVEPRADRSLVAPVRRTIQVETRQEGANTIYRLIYRTDSALANVAIPGPLYQFDYRIDSNTVEKIATKEHVELPSELILQATVEQSHTPLNAETDPPAVEHNVPVVGPQSNATRAWFSVLQAHGASNVENWDSKITAVGEVRHRTGRALFTETLDRGTISASDSIRYDYLYYLRRLHHLESGLLIRSYQVVAVKKNGKEEPHVVEAIDCEVSR